jgi:CubicO group peptidase (beta-lactamase class C family)
MSVRALAALGALAMCLAVGETTGRVAAQPADVAAIQARIEGPQSPAAGELGALTLQQIMERFGVPGVSVAIVHDFKLHWAKAYGTVDAATRTPVDPGTMFQAASISKPVHAMAVLDAVEDGRFGLDTDVNTLLKSWRVPRTDGTTGAAVTPRALLSHTSGADDGFGFPGYAPAAPRPTLRQILDGDAPSNVGPVLFARPPYAAYKYSGGAVTLMQLVMEDVLGQPADRFMRARVLDPLGMRDSTYEQPLPAARAARAARAHDREGRPRAAPWHVYPEQAAAGLWTTPGDLARVVIEVQRALRGPAGAVLSQGSAREMVTPIGVGPFAVGFSVERRGEGWYFSHGGSNWGFRAGIVGHVRKGYGLAVMTNADQGGAVIREIEARVAAAYRWDSLDRPLPR